MEQPNPDAPIFPHALHKSIEEAQLRRLKQYLPAGGYRIISVKDTILGLLSSTGSVQNPVYQAKDMSRYPGTAVDLSGHPLHFMHVVSSEVTSHGFVENLSKKTPKQTSIRHGCEPPRSH